MLKRHTVSIRNDVYTELRSYGKFGESFSEVVARLLDKLNENNGDKK